MSGADLDVRELRFSGATAPPPPPAPAPPPAAPTRTPTPCPDDPDLVMWDMVLSLCAPIDVAAAPEGAMSSSSGNRRDLETTHPGITRGDHAGRAQVESSQARTENDSCHPPDGQRSSGGQVPGMDTRRQHVRFVVPPQPRRQRDDVVPAQPGDYRMVSPTSQSPGHCADRYCWLHTPFLSATSGFSGSAAPSGAKACAPWWRVRSAACGYLLRSHMATIRSRVSLPGRSCLIS